MGMKLAKLLSLALLFFYFSCQNNKQHTPSVIPQNLEKEKIEVNREIIRRENADIELIAKRYKWDLTQSASGLQYQILNRTKGEFPKRKDIVKIKGIIMLPNGKEIYNSNTDGLKQFAVDMSEEPVGLHELVKLMRIGEKANAIIPSYLAYGISGDGISIPAASSLICKIELTNIN